MYEHSRRVPNVDNISEYYYNLKYLKGLIKEYLKLLQQYLMIRRFYLRLSHGTI
jgi:hypothetical protein